MSPIPEFTDAPLESTKSDDTAITVVTKNDTVTVGKTVESETKTNSEAVPQSVGNMSRSVVDTVYEDANPVQKAADTESSNLAEDMQSEKPSEISGSPAEEHWLEVSMGECAVMYHFNGITLTLHPFSLWM
jgi:hypothetical protein